MKNIYVWLKQSLVFGNSDRKGLIKNNNDNKDN